MTQLVLSLLKSNIGITDASLDASLTLVLDEAVGLAASFLDWPIVEETQTLIFDNFTGRPYLGCGHMPELVSLTFDGESQTLTDYLLDSANRLMKSDYGTVCAQLAVVEVKRGWDSEPYPTWLRQAIVLIAEALYTNRLTGGSFGAPAGESGPISEEHVMGVRKTSYAVTPSANDGTVHNFGRHGIPTTAARLLAPHRCLCI